MNNARGWVVNGALIFVLSGAIVMSAEPLPLSLQEPDQTRPTQVPDDSSKPPQSAASPHQDNSPTAPVHHELPDAPAPAQPVQQSQNQSSAQPQNPASVTSGAAGAKAPPVKGVPASRPVGAAIAPAKQHQRRSLLIKVGLVAGAAVAVGSAVALSKASPSKPPGAP
jgi:hypothetical protein